MNENVSAASVRLTAEEAADLTYAASKIKLFGDRYPEELRKMTGL